MNKSKIDEAIQLVPFSEEWSEIYQLESVRIQKKLGNKIIKMLHIGSTAIPNIYAKPIIDIMIGVRNINNVEPIIKILLGLGYEYFGEVNVPGRLYFRIRGVKNCNIALCQYAGEIWSNNLLFRDYLRKYSVVAKNYSELKKKVFDSGVDTLLKYSDAKHSFIQGVIKNAKEEQLR